MPDRGYYCFNGPATFWPIKYAGGVIDIPMPNRNPENIWNSNRELRLPEIYEPNVVKEYVFYIQVCSPADGHQHPQAYSPDQTISIEYTN